MIKREKPCNKGTRTAEGILDVCQTSAKLIIPTTESRVIENNRRCGNRSATECLS